MIQVILVDKQVYCIVHYTVILVCFVFIEKLWGCIVFLTFITSCGRLARMKLDVLIMIYSY